MSDDVRVLWEREEPGGRLQCIMRECCTGAELQLRRYAQPANGRPSQDDDAAIVLREVYPLKSDLYERAIELRGSYDTPG